MQDSIHCATDGGNPLTRIDLQGPAWPAAAILSAVGLWGGSFAAMRYVLQTLNPWSVMWLRMAIALAALLPLAGRLKRGGYQRGDWRLLVPMVLFQPCLYFWLESKALCLTTSSQAGVISASVPLMVSVGAYLLLSEPMGFRSILGLALSMAGVAGLTLMQGGRGQAVNPYLGNMLELGAMVCAAANMLTIKKLCTRYSSWTLTALQVAAGAIFFLPGLWFLIKAPPVRFTLSLVATVVFLGLFVTLAAFGLYNWGMSRMPAGKASIFINLVPVIAVLVGWLAMDETLTPSQCLAAFTVMGGVWISQKS
jgi:drug/metabolite transporter (DMT)-like permease